ncbi:MAG: hypothetical protein BGO67_08210 [Alphaproteobacteria bacterium 41-28]|nr:MAG: hypothetical protein BGO67_08210 [Alphaproteobacteria bacterium 41-28]
MEEEVLYTVDDQNVAWITLNRPQVRNALNEKMIQTLITHFRSVHEAPNLRALVIRGNGECFCSGADLVWMQQSAQLTDSANYDEARLLSQMLYSLDLIPIPTITYAHGAVIGGGIGILACSDLVIADTQTRFSFAETRIGLVPSIISPYVLRILGLRQTKRYFLTGEVFNAQVAQRIGLIHETVESVHADQEVEKFILNILEGDPQAEKEVKKLLYQMKGDIPENIRLRTIELIANLRNSEEGQQGIAAFLKKTTPPWSPKKPDDD